MVTLPLAAVPTPPVMIDADAVRLVDPALIRPKKPPLEYANRDTSPPAPVPPAVGLVFMTVPVPIAMLPPVPEALPSIVTVAPGPAGKLPPETGEVMFAPAIIVILKP